MLSLLCFKHFIQERQTWGI